MKAFLNSALLACAAFVIASTVSGPALGDEPGSCPPPVPFTDKNCILHYTLPAMVMPLRFGRAWELLNEAETGSLDKACVPRLHKFTRKVRWNWFKDRCKHANVEAVSAILNAGNSSKKFCRRIEYADGTHGFDLYTYKQLREYVVSELERGYPWLCH